MHAKKSCPFYKSCHVRGHTMLLHILILLFFFLLSAIKCEVLRQSPNGKISYSKPPVKNRIDWNEQAIYTCDQGFVLEGNKARTCGYPTTEGGLGQWSPDREPICVGEYRSNMKVSSSFTLLNLFLLNHVSTRALRHTVPPPPPPWVHFLKYLKIALSYKL